MIDIDAPVAASPKGSQLLVSIRLVLPSARVAVIASIKVPGAATHAFEESHDAITATATAIAIATKKSHNVIHAFLQHGSWKKE